MAAEKNQYPLSNARDLDPLMKAIGDARIVLLGEASHGTHEYYTWRTAVTRRLIEEKGFSFIAVEGDWPDCYAVNRYVKGYERSEMNPDGILRGFSRWPTWMWANWEVAGLLEWLRDHNKRWREKAGFYGLDVYSLWQSMEVLVDYLEKEDPAAARVAEKALACFEGAGRDEQKYAISSLSSPCREEVVRLLREVRVRAKNYNHDPEAELNALQNAHIAVEAEKYYSNMVQFDDKTWNIRDRHMTDTLNRILQFHGPQSRAIIWEHNSHIGDASFTTMADHGMFNVGQLVREQYPDQCFIAGFGSYSGTVIAASSWGAPICEMEVPPALPGSVEALLHEESEENRMIIFKGDRKGPFSGKLLHRAIGVVYDPENERYNYVPSVMSRRYDAFIYLDETSALHPLHVFSESGLVPDTYPFEY